MMYIRAVSVYFALTLITGLFFPLAVTAVSNLFFAYKSYGSLIVRDGKIVGSELLGQSFVSDKYFWGRPSATVPFPYNSLAGAGSNLAPSNPQLLAQVTANIERFHIAHDSTKFVPIDLVTSSASGLDPHISVSAAEYQIERVSKARALDPKRVKALVREHTEDRFLGLLGENRLNVLLLNLALDQEMP